jgi:hypothetical protein
VRESTEKSRSAQVQIQSVASSRASTSNGIFLDVLSSLSLPMERGTLAQKVLDAQMERDTGARRARGLRRMEGIVCGGMVICDVAVSE